MLAQGEQVALLSVGDLAPTERFETISRKDILQMAAAALTGAPAAASLLTLGPDDLPEMRALVEATEPGPFSARTAELGRFLGLRIGGRLAAMTGERMHLSGYTEVSAVCTDPAFRGRGLARALIFAVAQGIVARGETPFLHVYIHNEPAIALYRKLGFRDRATLRLTRLRRV